MVGVPTTEKFVTGCFCIMCLPANGLRLGTMPGLTKWNGSLPSHRYIPGAGIVITACHVRDLRIMGLGHRNGSVPPLVLAPALGSVEKPAAHRVMVRGALSSVAGFDRSQPLPTESAPAQYEICSEDHGTQPLLLFKDALNGFFHPFLIFFQRVRSSLAFRLMPNGCGYSAT